MGSHTSIITVSELATDLDKANIRVVDCRFDLMAPAQGRVDYLAGHIPGAVYAHLDDDLSAPVTPATGRHPLPQAGQFAATLQRLGISNNTQVVAYDGGPGAIAARLWWMLRWLGHHDVAVLDGGFAAWIADGQAVQAGEALPEVGDFAPRERPEWVLSTDELSAALARGDMPLLIDAREAARFNGEQEPIDAIAGHIPGAVNYPLTRGLDAVGRWRSPEALRGAWHEVFKGQPPAGWSVMCGSGVTACHLALSAERAGVPPPRLYAGSWSEWIRDPGRPTEP